MAIGSYEACIRRGTFKKLMAKVFGTQDYHSHIRIRPVINVCRKKNIHGSFLEIGCGSGMVAFELWRRGYIKNYLGIDLNKDSIDRARKIQKSLGADRISFVNEDAFVFLDSTNTGGAYDYVVLYDFIEHITNPEKFLEDLDCRLGSSKKAVYFVSVPTPIYPKVFGRRFHESIGHLVDGYTKREVDGLFEKIGYKSAYSEYNTGLLGNTGAWVFYHLKGKVHKRVLNLMTLPFRLFDINSEKLSSSLFCVYVNDRRKP